MKKNEKKWKKKKKRGKKKEIKIKRRAHRKYNMLGLSKRQIEARNRVAKYGSVSGRRRNLEMSGF